MKNKKNFSVPLYKEYSDAEIETLLNNPFQKNSLIQLNRLSYSEYMQMPLLNRVITRLFEIRTEPGTKQSVANNNIISSQGNGPIVRGIASYFFGHGDIFDDNGTITEFGDFLKTDMHELFKFTIQMAYESMPLCEGDCNIEIDGVKFDGFGPSLFLLKKLDGFVLTWPSNFQEVPYYPISMNPGDLYENPLSEHYDRYFESNFISFLLLFGLVNVWRIKGTEKLYVCKTCLFDKLITIRPPENLKNVA